MISKNDITDQFLSYINKLKHRHDLKIVDTHVHPFDVMGIVHYENDRCPPENDYTDDYLRPTLMEKLESGKAANALVKIAHRLFPRAVISEIESLYGKRKGNRVLDEMECALVDSAVLVPVEPWVSTSYIHRRYSQKSMFLLGSIDIHSSDLHAIEKQLTRYVTEFKIVGIKLHPNLQNFKPQPRDNPHELAEKLRLIYKWAEENKLYLLFHGGATNFTHYSDKRYAKFARSNTNGLLENFCNEKGESELFDKYDIPIIIAHLGHYGLNKFNSALIKKISDRHKTVYFDTSGVSPASIQTMIETLGSRRLIWGSDALYNRMIYGIYFVYKAAINAKSDEKLDEIMTNILGKNYYSSILMTQ